MDTKLLSLVYETVRDACRQPTNVFGFGIWTHHLWPMLAIAEELSPLHEADLEMALLSVLLHDYAEISHEEFIQDHHIHGANEAQKLPASYGYPDERTAIVEDAIRAHRGSVPGNKTSNEAACLADCDAIAHIQQFPSLFLWPIKREDIEGDWIVGNNDDRSDDYK